MVHPAAVLLISWFFMPPPPKTGFFQPLSRRLAQLCNRVFRVYLETMFNNTFQRTLPPCRSLTFLLNVGIESLNTSVRVCVCVGVGPFLFPCLFRCSFFFMFFHTVYVPLPFPFILPF